MLSINPSGVITHVDPVMPACVKVPHKREVLEALRNIYGECYEQEDNVHACEFLDTVCRYFGITLKTLIDDTKKA